MMRKQINKAIEIFSLSLMFIGIVYLYIYKTLSLLETNVLSAKYFYYIFAIFAIYMLIRIIFAILEKKNMSLNIIFSIIEIVIVVYFILVCKSLTWPYIIMAFAILYTTIYYGKIYGLIYLISSSIVTLSALIFGNLYINFSNNPFEYFLFYSVWIYIVQIYFWYIASIALKWLDGKFEQIDNDKHKFEQQIKDIEKLQGKNADLNELNQILEESNKKLENTNQRLNKSAAEFYTLQQISQAIATILDVKELLKFVNDVIVGVMGVSYCTILLLDKERNKMTIKITNIYAETGLDMLKKHMNSDLLKDVISTGNHLIDNNVEDEKYGFTKERGIKSLLCIPLSSKNESYGVVLVEQERPDAFEDEHVKFLSAISNQISVALENVGLYEKMQQMATTDALTKIYNRLYFNEMLSKEMANADKDSYPMCVSIFDIDHFKKFNDTYGHLFGDLVLKTIAKLAKDHVREQDIVARFGGEEFVIIMPNTTTPEAYDLIESLRETISQCHVKEGTISASVTVSFGIACYPNHGGTEAEVLSAADTALYKAKVEGRNCVRVFEKQK